MRSAYLVRSNTSDYLLDRLMAGWPAGRGFVQCGQADQPVRTWPMTVGASDSGGGAAGPPAGATAAGPDTGTAPSRAAPLRPGDPRRLGAYQLLGRLGEGGMGTVFLAESAEGRLVAVKVVRPEYAQDEGFRARFRREAEAAQRVARFCTAQVLAAGTAGEVTYIVTEYIDGPTLAAAVAQQGPLHGSMLDSLAIGMAAALSGIHAAGVVHRDLKPSNVLLSQVGPKVIDFGIARALDGADGLTQSGQLVGTPAYMAPEQFRGASTTATDVFAWGAVVAFAGTGRSPFGSGSAYELMRRVSTERPDLDGLDGSLRGLVGRAMDKEPARRPSARTLLLALTGEAEDPLDASTRIVRTGWTAPADPAAPTQLAEPAARTELAEPAAPTVLAAPDRSGRWRPRAVAVVAASVTALGLTLGGVWLSAIGDPNGGGSGANPPASRSAEAAGSETPLDREAETSPDQPDGSGDGSDAADPQPVTVGDRVPAADVTTLELGQIHHYWFELATDQQVYLQGMVENCAHQLPWVMTDGAGSTVGNGTMICRTDGPLSLSAGRYGLQIGDGNVDGKYAFRLTSR
jgi:hypothetical protein